MAHECPDCGAQCHCGGDIDDLLLNSSQYENHCDHCAKADREYEEFINEQDDSETIPTLEEWREGWEAASDEGRIRTITWEEAERRYRKQYGRDDGHQNREG